MHLKIIQVDCHDVESNVQKGANVYVILGWWSFSIYTVNKQVQKVYGAKKKILNCIIIINVEGCEIEQPRTLL